MKKLLTLWQKLEQSRTKIQERIVGVFWGCHELRLRWEKNHTDPERVAFIYRLLTVLGFMELDTWVECTPMIPHLYYGDYYVFRCFVLPQALVLVAFFPLFYYWAEYICPNLIEPSTKQGLSERGLFHRHPLLVRLVLGIKAWALKDDRSETGKLPGGEPRFVRPLLRIVGLLCIAPMVLGVPLKFYLSVRLGSYLLAVISIVFLYALEKN